MKPIIIYIILLNRVMSQTVLNPVNEINALQGETESNFSLRETGTSSETSPAVSPGYNLDAAPPTDPDKMLEAREENFRAISPIYSIEKTNANEKTEGDAKKMLSFHQGNSSTQNENNEVSSGKNSTPNASQLVWDNCYETTYRDNRQVNPKVHYDMENAHHLEIENGGMLRKRDFLENNSSLAVKSWIEKYNNLKNAITGRKTSTQGTEILSTPPSMPTEYTDETFIDIDTIEMNPVQIIPITKDIFKEYEYSEPYNVTLDVLVTENNIKASYTEDWFGDEDRTKIKFTSMPQTQTYLIPKFKLEEGFHPFSFMSQFFAMIYPFDFPVGKLF